MSFPFEKRTELSPGIEQVEESAFAVVLAFVLTLFSGMLFGHVLHLTSCEATPGVVTENMAYDPEAFIRPPPVEVSAREASLQGFSETVIPSWGYVYYRDTDVLTI